MYKQRWLLIILLFVATTVTAYAVLHESKQGVLTVAFLDVGQGDAIFIESPTGVQVLIDGGAGSSVLRELGRVMPFYDHSIDIVLATHPDADHIGGLLPVLKRYKVNYIMRSGVEHSTPATESLLQLISTRGHRMSPSKVQEIMARRGQVVDIGGGAYLRILFPDRDVAGLAPNTASVIVQLVYDDHKFLLTGDSPDEIEEYLVRLGGTALKSNVLKLGHHGSKTSSADLFLGFVEPEYAIISAAKDSRYGHPHQIVLDRLEKFKIPTLSTAKSGTIIFKTDGVTLRLVK